MQDSDYDAITQEQTITVNVTGNASSYQVTGKPVLENNGVKLTELGIVSDTDSFLYGYHIFYEVENGTSDTIMSL